MGPNAYYAIQPAFTGGEISPDVASRVDIDKYQLALLQAENVIIRPYGAAVKRPGLIYCGATKKAAKKSILWPFKFSVSINYLLEFGDQYVRVWREGTYLNVELSTPFTEADLSSLRFVQSVDVLYITSGKYPVQVISRISESNWSIAAMTFAQPPMGDLNPNSNLTITPSAVTGSSITLTASAALFTNPKVGSWMEISQRISGQSVSLSVSRENPASALTRYTIETAASWNENTSFTYPYNPEYYDPNEGYYTPSSAVTETWRSALNRLATTASSTVSKEDVPASGTTTQTSASIGVGSTWKIITHGTWKGTVTVESSLDGSTWLEERNYTSNNDFNPTETGTVEQFCFMRVTVSVNEGTCTCDFSSLPYTHTGYVEISAVTDSTHATANVKERLGATTATSEFKFSAWDSVSGYPSCATFFQDRLCFAGSDAYPQRVWMSKTGDYANFGVEKAGGTVTDDSAVTADLLSLQSYRIHHMLAANDLILLTEGNEWTISGSETVTPSTITPRSQQSYGANDVIPIRSGNRIVYVQRRGSIVRDIGYNFDSDSYAGADLTLLVRHLIRGHQLTGSTYAQEPDSIIYFIRDDGVLLSLTYMWDQKVYGWSHIVTDGTVESVCAVGEGNRDVVYCVVNRTINGSTVRYIERFDESRESGSTQQQFVMMDSAKIYSFVSATSTITGLSHLNGKKVLAMGDGYLFDPITVSSGSITLPQASKIVVVGLPYTMRIEQPNIESQTNTGTLQGREKAVTTIILRLTNSFGGEVGPDESTLNELIYDVDRMQLGENVLFSGDLLSTMAAGGFNKNGRVFIKHETPYPFTLSAIVRGVTFGGTGGLRD